MGCKKCGMCCRALWLPLSYSEIIARSMNQKCELGIADRNNTLFALKYFYPITRERAVIINPHLKTWNIFNSKIGYFYGCYLFDEKTSMCKAYDARPYICSGFPYYDKDVLPTLYSADCGYSKTQLSVLDSRAEYMSVSLTDHITPRIKMKRGNR